MNALDVVKLVQPVEKDANVLIDYPIGFSVNYYVSVKQDSHVLQLVTGSTIADSGLRPHYRQDTASPCFLVCSWFL